MLTEDEEKRGAVIVTRADRDATILLLQKAAPLNWVILHRVIGVLKDDRMDEYGLSHILAHHRLGTERQARIDGARLGLATAARLVRTARTAGHYSYPSLNLPDIEAMLSRMSPEEVVAGKGTAAAILHRRDGSAARFA